jgi:energy-converting hydrogenase Eha subunit H
MCLNLGQTQEKAIRWYEIAIFFTFFVYLTHSARALSLSVFVVHQKVDHIKEREKKIRSKIEV